MFEYAKSVVRNQVTKTRTGQSLVDSAIGIMVATIVIGAVALPAMQDVLNTTNFTGTTGTILDFVPLGLALALFVGAISLVRSR